MCHQMIKTQKIYCRKFIVENFSCEIGLVLVNEDGDAAPYFLQVIQNLKGVIVFLHIWV